MAYPKQIWVDEDPSTPVSAARMSYIEDGIEQAHILAESNATGGSSDFGAVLLDSFTGASDDLKLGAALTAVAADTYPRTIQLSNRQYNFTTGNRTAFDGMRIAGPTGFGNPERQSGTKTPGRVNLNMTTPWFLNGGVDVFGCSFRNLSFTATGSNATVIGQSVGGSWYELSMRDIFTSGLRTVIGTQATKVTLTSCSFTGDWGIQNCYNGAIHIGGTGNMLWPSGMILDSTPAFLSAGGAAGQAHLWCDQLDKTYIGPIYVIAEGDWRAIRHDGPDLNSGSTVTGQVVYSGVRMEGRSPTAACNGSLFKMSGGVAEIRSGWIAYAMVSPSGTEKGVIHHDAGQLDVSGVTFDRANAQAVTVPLVYTAGGAGKDVIVQRVKRASRGGSWTTSRPVVARATAGAENRITDATVTQTTV